MSALTDVSKEISNVCLLCKTAQPCYPFTCDHCRLGVCKSCAETYVTSETNTFVLREGYFRANAEWDLSNIACNICENSPISMETDVFVLPKSCNIDRPKKTAEYAPLPEWWTKFQAMKSACGCANVKYST